MSEILDVIYKLITREQMTGYKDSSALEGFEQVVGDLCDRELTANSDEQTSKILQDMKMTSQNYGTASREIRERKITEIGRMLLNLRDVLQQRSAFHGQPERIEAKEKVVMYKQEGKLSEAIAELSHFSVSKLDLVFGTLRSYVYGFIYLIDFLYAL